MRTVRDRTQSSSSRFQLRSGESFVQGMKEPKQVPEVGMKGRRAKFRNSLSANNFQSHKLLERWVSRLRNDLSYARSATDPILVLLTADSDRLVLLAPTRFIQQQTLI